MILVVYDPKNNTVYFLRRDGLIFAFLGVKIGRIKYDTTARIFYELKKQIISIHFCYVPQNLKHFPFSIHKDLILPVLNYRSTTNLQNNRSIPNQTFLLHKDSLLFLIQFHLTCLY